MNTLTIINVVILCCIFGMLIVYPVIVYFIIKKQYIPAILGDVVDSAIKKVDKLVDKELVKINKEIDKYYANVIRDVNIIRVKTITDLDFIITHNIEKLVKTVERAKINLDFE